MSYPKLSKPTYSSSSESDDESAAIRRLFRHDRSLHEVIGGGKVADVLLWRNINVSAALLIGMTAIWFLFEIVEYNLVTLLCHVSITAMLALFIWGTLADIFKWSPPKIPEMILQDSSLRELASTFHRRTNQLLSMILDIVRERDLPRLVMAVLFFYLLSVIGSCFDFLNFLYLGFLCMITLPFAYERYEEELNYLAGRFIQEWRRGYRRFDRKFLNKIPRGPVKDKKVR